MKSAVITGVSSGIGYDAARFLIEKDFRVFGSVRKAEDGDRIRQELGANFFPLVFDVRDQEAINRAVEEVRNNLEGNTLSVLINNAGIAISAPLQFVPIDTIQYQFEINVFGLLRVSQAFLPLLGATNPPAKNPGKIINISSVSGLVATPFMGPYAGSKFAVEAFSDSLRRELMIYGVDVIVIQPGPIKTPIWEKALDLDLSSYKGTIYEPIMEKRDRVIQKTYERALDVAEVTNSIYEAIVKNKPKTRYLVAARASAIRFFIMLPDRMKDRMSIGSILKGKLPGR